MGEETLLAKKLAQFISALDWNGHVEISDQDTKWLARNIVEHFVRPILEAARKEPR